MSWNEFLPELAVKHEVLETLYLAIGTPDFQKEKDCHALFERFMVVMNDHIRTVEQEKIRLFQESEALLNDIRRMTTLVGQAEDGVEKLVETLEGMSLWARHGLCKEEQAYIREHYQQKLDDVRLLHGQLAEYATILGSSYVQPGPYPEEGAAVTFDVVQQFSDNIAACEQEQKRRKSVAETAVITIKHLWNELGMTAQDAFERDVINSEQGEYPISDEAMRRLDMKQSMLEDERTKRETLVKEHLIEITKLWDKLRIEEDEREQFMSEHVGLRMETIRAYKSELSRLEELKGQKLEEFILDERDTLFELWDRLYYALEQRESFTPVFSEIYADEVLAQHEAEVSRLKQELEEKEHILSAIERYRMLLDDIREFEITSMDSQRLFHRDPGRLLREEKFRKRIARDFPKIESELEEVLYQWQQDKGRPFLVYGEEYIVTMKAHAQEAREGKENEKLWREQRKHLSLQRDLRYGSQNPKNIKNAPQSPHPRRISPTLPAPMTPSGRRPSSPPPSFNGAMPQTPSKRNAMIGANHSRPGTPSSQHTRTLPTFIPTTPTRARSHTLHTVPQHPSTAQYNHKSNNSTSHLAGSKFYSRSESPATPFSLSQQPSTPTKNPFGGRSAGGPSMVMLAGLSEATATTTTPRRNHSIISISSTTTEHFVEPTIPSRSRIARPISYDLTGQRQQQEERGPSMMIVSNSASSSRQLKRTAADLSSPNRSPPTSPSRRKSRSISPDGVSSASSKRAPFMMSNVGDDAQGSGGQMNMNMNPFTKRLLEMGNDDGAYRLITDMTMDEDEESVVELDQTEVKELFPSTSSSSSRDHRPRTQPRPRPRRRNDREVDAQGDQDMREEEDEDEEDVVEVQVVGDGYESEGWETEDNNEESPQRKSGKGGPQGQTTVSAAKGMVHRIEDDNGDWNSEDEACRIERIETMKTGGVVEPKSV